MARFEPLLLRSAANGTTNSATIASSNKHIVSSMTKKKRYNLFPELEQADTLRVSSFTQRWRRTRHERHQAEAIQVSILVFFNELTPEVQAQVS